MRQPFHLNESFGSVFLRRILPFSLIWIVLAVERSAWFALMLPVGVAFAWLRSRKHGRRTDAPVAPSR
jgi:hypothetical protein